MSADGVSPAMRLGLFDLIGLAGTLVFALPVANVGVIRLIQGETLLGAGLVVVAVAMVILPQFFFDPGRLVGGLFRGLVPKRLRGGSDDGNDGLAGDERPADK